MYPTDHLLTVVLTKALIIWNGIARLSGLSFSTEIPAFNTKSVKIWLVIICNTGQWLGFQPAQPGLLFPSNQGLIHLALKSQFWSSVDNANVTLQNSTIFVRFRVKIKYLFLFENCVQSLER